MAAPVGNKFYLLSKTKGGWEGKLTASQRKKQVWGSVPAIFWEEAQKEVEKVCAKFRIRKIRTSKNKNSKPIQHNHKELTSVSSLTRDGVVPYYVDLLKKADTELNLDDVVRINKLILSKWSNSGLVYIKEKAWKKFKVK